MSEDASGAQGDADDPMDREEYGGLSLEDDPQGTVDPAELAGTASEDDDDIGYEPEFSEADEPPE